MHYNILNGIYGKIINGMKYYMPNNLTLEQKAIYVHIIDWKRKTLLRREVCIEDMNTMPFSQKNQRFLK